MKKKRLSEVLREAIKAYPGSMLEIEKKTGIHRGSIARFVNGERSLRLDRAEVLIDFLGIEYHAPKRRK